MVPPSALMLIGSDHPPDPQIAPIGAGSEPVAILWLVGAAIVVAIVALLWARRRASSDGIT